MVTASGGQGAQFSWFQGGFVRPLFITACGEISFIKMVRLGGVTLLTTCWKNIIPPLLVGVPVIAFSPLPAPSLSRSLLTYHLFFLLLPLPFESGSCLGGWAQHSNTLWEGRHACVLQVWTPEGQGAVDRMSAPPGSAAVLLVFAARTALRIRAGAQ